MVMSNTRYLEYLRYATRMILVVASVGTLGVMFDQQGGFSVGALPLDLIGISPYVFLARMSSTMGKNLSQSLVVFIGTLAISAFGAYTLIDSLYLTPLDPQSPLVFVFVPAYQWAGALAFAFLAKVLV